MELGVDRAPGLPLARRIKRRLRLASLRLLQRAERLRLILPYSPIEGIRRHLPMHGLLLRVVKSLREGSRRLLNHLFLQRLV